MLRNLTVVFLVLAHLFFMPLVGWAFEIVETNGLRYEASMASSAVHPSEYCRVPFGKEKNQVGGWEEAQNGGGNGVPSAFLPMDDGSVWLLDDVNQSLKRFSPPGKLVEEFPFSKIGASQSVLVRDFALLHRTPSGPSLDGVYVFCPNDGMIRLLNEKGMPQVEIEGLLDTWAISGDGKGNVVANNPRMNAVLRFNSKGELIEKFGKTLDLSEYVDNDGNCLGIRGTASSAILFRIMSGSGNSEVDIASFSLDVPAERDAEFTSRKVIGLDGAGNIYLELVAADKNGVIHQHRICAVSQTGEVIKKSEINVIPCMAPDIPRQLAVMADGKILGFYVDGKNYVLCTYTLP